MKFLWKLFYGKERVARAMAYGKILEETSCNIGKLGYAYNSDGEQIRGTVYR